MDRPSIQEAKQRGDCLDCAYRLVDPGEMRCVSPHPEDKPCPGRRTRQEMRGEEHKA